MAACGSQQFAVGVGDRLQVDVAPEVVILAQLPCHFHQLAHRVVRAANHA
jgi:hypothetical protein